MHACVPACQLQAGPCSRCLSFLAYTPLFGLWTGFLSGSWLCPAGAVAAFDCRGSPSPSAALVGVFRGGRRVKTAAFRGEAKMFGGVKRR